MGNIESRVKREAQTDRVSTVRQETRATQEPRKATILEMIETRKAQKLKNKK